MKRTVKGKATIVFLAMTISILCFTICNAYAFDRTACNSNHSALFNACYDKSGGYGWDKTDTKQAFNNGCYQTAVTILNKCYNENACSAFRSFLSVSANTCNSLTPAAKQDGCFEIYRQWTNLYDGKIFSPCIIVVN